MQAASINTSYSDRASVYFETNPFVQRVSDMQKITILLCVLPTAFSIIVKDPPPSPNDYKYSYDVQDATTGDRKSQHEVRQGNLVTGAYTVIAADGTKRTVEYTADDKHGFKAVISEEPSETPVVPPKLGIAYQPLPSQNFNVIQYQSTSKPGYAYQAKPTFYFTPENVIQSQIPLQNGHYFLPAFHH